MTSDRADLKTAYGDFIEAVSARVGDLDIGPVTASQQRELEARYDLDEAVRSIVLARYPRQPIPPPDCDGRLASYEGTMLLPPVPWLVSHADEDDRWPRIWFPLSVTGDHQIQFSDRETPGVFEQYTDETPYERGRAVYASMTAFVRAATATVRYLTPEAFEPRKTGRWFFRRDVERLRPEVLEAILTESCGADDGPQLLPQTGVVLPT
jgi:hypothetical protein